MHFGGEKPDPSVTDPVQRIETRIAGSTAAILVAAVLLALTGAGVAVVRSLGPAAAGADAAALRQATVPVPPPAPAGPSGDPLRVRIPAIGVTAPLVRLGLNPDRTLEVPSYEEAGWYAGGSRPGDPGPAVIAAHVDSTSGPSVFYRLQELNPGDAVHVDYRDGSVSFVVTRSESFPKSNFPTDHVYGWTPRPELRLITCDGTFDRKARSYRSNLIVWADVAPGA